MWFEEHERPSSTRWRSWLSLVAVVACASLLAACGGDDGSSDAAANKKATTSRAVTTTGAATTTGGTRPTTPASAATSAVPPPTEAPPSRPVINSFTASATTIACPAPSVSTSIGPATITLSWTTGNATGVDLGVDGPGVYASYGPNASTSITVPCDGNTHTYQLTAKGSSGASTSQTISVSTRT
jgi:hypothetical protein